MVLSGEKSYDADSDGVISTGLWPTAQATIIRVFAYLHLDAKPLMTAACLFQHLRMS